MKKSTQKQQQIFNELMQSIDLLPYGDAIINDIKTGEKESYKMIVNILKYNKIEPFMYSVNTINNTMVAPQMYFEILKGEALNKALNYYSYDLNNF